MTVPNREPVETCTCGGLPAHSHVYVQEWVDMAVATTSTTLIGNPVARSTKMLRPRDTGEVRIWVDWKAVARELAMSS